MLARWLVAMLWVGSVALGSMGVSGCSHADLGSTNAHADDRIYVCPMHCVQPGHTEPYSQHGPGDCPVCGMHLVPKPPDDTPPSGGSGH